MIKKNRKFYKYFILKIKKIKLKEKLHFIDAFTDNRAPSSSHHVFHLNIKEVKEKNWFFILH